MLSEYMSNTYSQHGDDGMIEEVMRRFGIEEGLCAEVGGHDGRNCSNTLLLRERGWSAVLIEADPALHEKCRASFESDRVTCLRRFISPTGPDSLNHLLSPDTDFLSLDIDGDDYLILEQLELRPRLLVLEFNPSVPWFLDVKCREPGNPFGASALAYYRLMESKGFVLVGANYANMYFVPEEFQTPLLSFVEPYDVIMSEFPLATAFVVTDQQGYPFVLGTNRLPWGALDLTERGGDWVEVTDKAAQVLSRKPDYELEYGTPWNSGKRAIYGLGPDGKDLWMDL